MILNDLGAEAGDDEEVPHAGLEQAVEDVFQDGFALDTEHRFGQFPGQLPHARALARGQNHSFHINLPLVRAA